MRTMIWTIAALLTLPGLALADNNGYIGIYAGAAGTATCANVPQGTGTTLWILANLAGPSAGGIWGAEFRIEVSNPAGWFFAFNPPEGSTPLGNLLDTDPENLADGSGLDIAFSTCREPSDGKVLLGTIGVFNLSGGPTTLAVKRHSDPPNPLYSCPLFVLCDPPVFSQTCTSQGIEPPCNLVPLKGAVLSSSGDPAWFVAGLNADPEDGPGPRSARPAPGDLLAAVPGLIADLPEPDIVGLTGPGKPAPTIATPDTMWIADWDFDSGSQGWTHRDNLIREEDSNCNGINGTCWHIAADYVDPGNLTVHGNAAVLRQSGCYGPEPGYGNFWDYSIKLRYRGASTLQFNYVLGSESDADFDGLFVEADSLDSSNLLPDCDPEDPIECYEPPPGGMSRFLEASWRYPHRFRRQLLVVEGGEHFDGSASIVLPDFGLPSLEHTVYIRFASGSTGSDEDRKFDSPIDAALIVDDISVTGGLTYVENFEGELGPYIQFIQSGRTKPFAFLEHARLYLHITDNEKCAENTTTAWLVTEPTYLAHFPEMAFGPGQAVVRNWLDDVFVSPWIGLPVHNVVGSVLSFREFPGQRYSKSKTVRGVSLRGKVGDCVTKWGGDTGYYDPRKSTWFLLDSFNWVTRVVDLSPFFDANWDSVQVRFRISDWQWIAGANHFSPEPGPGPYIDDVRFGLVDVSPILYPGWDTRTQAQDCFPTVQNSIPGEHFDPSADLLETCAFSGGADLGIPNPPVYPGDPNVITQDGIYLQVQGSESAPVTKVSFCYSIVSGPHAHREPGIFMVMDGTGVFPVFQAHGNGIVEHSIDFSAQPFSGARVFGVDFDDTYFRGGDVVQYFWYAKSRSGIQDRHASYPPGIAVEPSALGSMVEAELSTGGLLEWNALPAINWDPEYVARVQADPVGDFDPSEGERAGSSQANCILYVNMVNFARRSGSGNRTSFMYTLDHLGYRNHYDVYDLQGHGSTNNDLGGRLLPAMGSRYALIVHDVGRLRGATIPDGSDWSTMKVNQAQWYRDYLALGLTGYAGSAALWIIGENWAYENLKGTSPHPLFGTDLGLTSPIDDQDLVESPNVVGVSSYTFHTGAVQSFAGDEFTLLGGCPQGRTFDEVSPAGVAVVTHRYKAGTSVSPGGAVVMNKNTQFHWSSMSTLFNWFDIVALAGPNPPHPNDPLKQLAGKVLAGVLPANCVATEVTGTEADQVPLANGLYSNFPNPFNPVTTIPFDLARDMRIKLCVFDISGRRVRMLVDARMPARQHRVVWDGLDDEGRPVASGLYLAQLEAEEFSATKKLVLIR